MARPVRAGRATKESGNAKEGTTDLLNEGGDFKKNASRTDEEEEASQFICLSVRLWLWVWFELEKVGGGSIRIG